MGISIHGFNTVTFFFLFLLSFSWAIFIYRGLEKKGGKLLYRSHVEEIMIDNGRAVGVRLRGGKTIKAKKAVVSNASSWDTLPLIPEQERKPDFAERLDAPLNRSFMHVHLGFDATGSD